MIWKTKIRVVGCCLIIAIIGLAILIPYVLDAPSIEKTRSGMVTFSSVAGESVYVEGRFSFMTLWETRGNYTASGGVEIGFKFTSTLPFQNLSFSMYPRYSSGHGNLSVNETVTLKLQSQTLNESWTYSDYQGSGWWDIGLGNRSSSLPIFNPDRLAFNATLWWRWILTDVEASGDTHESRFTFTITLTERLHLHDMGEVRTATFWSALLGIAVVVIGTWKYQSIRITED